MVPFNKSSPEPHRRHSHTVPVNFNFPLLLIGQITRILIKMGQPAVRWSFVFDDKDTLDRMRGGVVKVETERKSQQGLLFVAQL